jgi:hypothetical protein
MTFCATLAPVRSMTVSVEKYQNRPNKLVVPYPRGEPPQSYNLGASHDITNAIFSIVFILGIFARVKVGRHAAPGRQAQAVPRR